MLSAVVRGAAVCAVAALVAIAVEAVVNAPHAVEAGGRALAAYALVAVVLAMCAAVGAAVVGRRRCARTARCAAPPGATASRRGGWIAHGRDDPERVVFAGEHHKRIYAAITTGFTLVRDERHNLHQLVELGADSGETRDDARADNPAIYARLEQALIAWRERILAGESR